MKTYIVWFVTHYYYVGVYGDVQRVKILYNKKDSALIQMAEPHQAHLGIIYTLVLIPKRKTFVFYLHMFYLYMQISRSFPLLTFHIAQSGKSEYSLVR